MTWAPEASGKRSRGQALVLLVPGLMSDDDDDEVQIIDDDDEQQQQHSSSSTPCMCLAYVFGMHDGRSIVLHRRLQLSMSTLITACM
jgi:hypothetical protein